MKDNTKLTILQINDTHGFFEPHLEWMAGPHQPAYRTAGGFARIGTLIRKIREETQGLVLFCEMAILSTEPTPLCIAGERFSCRSSINSG